MIIYFSATGNCKHIAKVIASKTSDSALSMTELKDIFIKDGENLGFVIPTYFWGLPAYVEEFLTKVVISCPSNTYIYCVTTYGTTCGQIDYFLEQLLAKQNLALAASYAIKTVDNWTVKFNVKDEQKIIQTLANEEKQTKEVIKDILSKRTVYISKDKKSIFMCKKARYFYNKARRTKHFDINNSCIGCGLCEKLCPEKAIRLENNSPSFVKDKCSICFACLHSCPKNAISYAKKTQNNGQYLRAKYTKDSD